MSGKIVRILGTRGIPAQHGGFETFAEHLALFLVARGWTVVVYCQTAGTGEISEGQWRGVRLVSIPVPLKGSLGTVLFDWKSVAHAAKTPELVLTLGYNTAAFCWRYRLRQIHNLINMDGIEWRREKWSTSQRIWLWANERLGCWLGNHLIADHPEIKHHLESRVRAEKITTIPYGADRVVTADPEIPRRFGLEPDQYLILIARPEPENSILEVVTAFSARPRGLKLALLGTYEPTDHYQQQVLAAASDEVVFPGAIYDKVIVQALRRHSRLYVHGHTVGGTNPSLVEAMGAGSAVLAHDNPFNRWVAGPEAAYFTDTESCATAFDTVLLDPAQLAVMRQASRTRHAECFTWATVLAQYERLLSDWT